MWTRGRNGLWRSGDEVINAVLVVKEIVGLVDGEVVSGIIIRKRMKYIVVVSSWYCCRRVAAVDEDERLVLGKASCMDRVGHGCPADPDWPQ